MNICIGVVISFLFSSSDQWILFLWSESYTHTCCRRASLFNQVRASLSSYLMLPNFFSLGIASERTVATASILLMLAIHIYIISFLVRFELFYFSLVIIVILWNIKIQCNSTRDNYKPVFLYALDSFLMAFYLTLLICSIQCKEWIFKSIFWLIDGIVLWW